MMPNRENTDIAGLWSEGFGDDPEFVSEYLGHWRGKGLGFVRREGERIVSAADMHRFCGDITSAGYIYGVVTAKDFRGWGLSGSIIREMLERLYNSGEYLAMLIAADDRLSEWYMKFGFSHRATSPVELYADGFFDFGTGDRTKNLLQYRIVNVRKYLSVYASAYPDKAEFTIAVKDDILPANNGVYTVGEGRADLSPSPAAEYIAVSQLFDLYPLAETRYAYTPFPG